MTAPTIREIQRATAAAFGVPVETMAEAWPPLRWENRSRRIGRARQAAMYLAWKLTGKGTSAIGRAFNRNHATVLYAISRILDVHRHEPDFNRRMAKALASLELGGAIYPRHPPARASTVI